MSTDLAAIEARAEALVEAHQRLMRELIALRTKHNLSQDEVAIRMGVTQPTVSAFERYDSNPRLSTIRRYALAVDGRIENKVVDDCVDHSDRVFDAFRSEEIVFPARAAQQFARYSAWVPSGHVQVAHDVNS